MIPAVRGAVARSVDVPGFDAVPMEIASGKVVDGRVELDGALPEGATVTVLAHGVDEAFEVEDTEQALLRAIEQSRRALFASHASVAANPGSGSQLLADCRSHRAMRVRRRPYRVSAGTEIEMRVDIVRCPLRIPAQPAPSERTTHASAAVIYTHSRRVILCRAQNVPSQGFALHHNSNGEGVAEEVAIRFARAGTTHRASVKQGRALAARRWRLACLSACLLKSQFGYDAHVKSVPATEVENRLGARTVTLRWLSR
jgi:hypothetical protein